MSRVESEEPFLLALCCLLHAADGLVQDGVAQERVPRYSFFSGLSLVLYLMRLDHLEVVHGDTAVLGAGKLTLWQKRQSRELAGVGSPELLGGDVHDPGHLLIGSFPAACYSDVQVLRRCPSPGTGSSVGSSSSQSRTEHWAGA